jgi:hypothetical protein
MIVADTDVLIDFLAVREPAAPRTARAIINEMKGDDAVLRELASRYVWWEPPERALERRCHFICQLLQLGTAEDVRSARQILGDEALREALSSAPPGVLDARSWSFWHLVLFGRSAPPLPSRPLPP